MVHYLELSFDSSTDIYVAFLVSASSQKAARIDKTSSDRVKSTPLGKEAIFKCVYTGNPPPEVHWTKNKKKLGDNCKFCVQKVENLNGVSVLRVTPYRDTDFGDYKCKARNKLGFDHITVKLLEDKSKSKFCDTVSIFCHAHIHHLHFR